MARAKVRDASSRWLPGSRPASRRSVPLGACELYDRGKPSSNRTWIFVIPVPAGVKPATSLRVEPEAEPVQQPQPRVATPLVAVGPRDLRINHRPTFAHVKVADRRRVVRYIQR